MILKVMKVGPPIARIAEVISSIEFFLLLKVTILTCLLFNFLEQKQKQLSLKIRCVTFILLTIPFQRTSSQMQIQIRIPMMNLLIQIKTNQKIGKLFEIEKDII